MSHNIYLYSCSADPQTVNKSGSLSLIGSAEVVRPVHQINVVKPVVTVDYNASLINANYCYIDTFGRWYFCTVSVDTAQRMTISCSVDVLYTYNAAIAASPATVIRRQNYMGQTGATYVPDTKLPLDRCRVAIEGIKRSIINPTSGGFNYFLAINGG